MLTVCPPFSGFRAAIGRWLTFSIARDPGNGVDAEVVDVNGGYAISCHRIVDNLPGWIVFVIQTQKCAYFTTVLDLHSNRRGEHGPVWRKGIHRL